MPLECHLGVMCEVILRSSWGHLEVILIRHLRFKRYKAYFRFGSETAQIIICYKTCRVQNDYCSVPTRNQRLLRIRFSVATFEFLSPVICLWPNSRCESINAPFPDFVHCEICRPFDDPLFAHDEIQELVEKRFHAIQNWWNAAQGHISVSLSLSLFTAQSSMNKVTGDHFSGSAKMWALNGWTRHYSGDQRSMRIQNSPTSSGFSPKNMFCHISGSQLCKCENNWCGRIIDNFTTDVSPFRLTGASNW